MDKQPRPQASDTHLERMYMHLGALFYAIAKADGRAHPKEVKALRESVKKHWLDLEDSEDAYHTNAAYQIEAVFDHLEEREGEAEDAFDDFQLFVKHNPNLFSLSVVKRIRSTARHIAEAFSGTNKSELDMLLRLDILLKSVTDKNQSDN